MKEDKKKEKSEIVIPKYSALEEKMNMISHIVGVFFGLVALIMTLIYSSKIGSTAGIITSIVYSLSIIILYACSSYYHGLRNLQYKRIFRVLDHCSIYLLIAGTYTILSVCGVVPIHPAIGWVIFGCVWLMAILGIVLNAINIEKFKIVSLILNILIGWFAVFFSSYVIDAITLPGFMMIVSGGICYTVGAITYAIGKKKRYFHFVFHLLCLVGTIVHFLGIFIFCI